MNSFLIHLRYPKWFVGKISCGPAARPWSLLLDGTVGYFCFHHSGEKKKLPTTARCSAAKSCNFSAVPETVLVGVGIGCWLTPAANPTIAAMRMAQNAPVGPISHHNSFRFSFVIESRSSCPIVICISTILKKHSSPNDELSD